jgi:hypothetical protein
MAVTVHFASAVGAVRRSFLKATSNHIAAFLVAVKVCRVAAPILIKKGFPPPMSHRLDFSPLQNIIEIENSLDALFVGNG